MRDLHLKAGATLAVLTASLRNRVQEIRSQPADRGDGPIPTVIIVLATIAGAALIAGTLAVVYSKYNGKLLSGK
ncbi:hypothetical protein ACIBK8_28500 [Streptomyces sp. NPDC050161]|uniref:hypothetical protein n=1 Tax=Streptomyces sp. NPDC050161 TaxID=3365604 RepID=UPI00378D7985